eukprot:Nitzschia sp. Nitz4//scaffold44_size153857//136976//138509//NITZ4_002747-RA/size153857-augustus-gene-0.29-mRNA-1//-1//CDS//3329552235//6818//frame0
MDGSAPILIQHSKFSTLRAREMGLFCDPEVLTRAGLCVDRFPMDAEEHQRAEVLLAQELNKLSLQEQEQVMFDLHGLPQDHHDDPKNVEYYLQEMEKEILKVENREAYDLAKYLNPEYVTNRGFRLMFLRGDFFDVKLAAERIVYHFEMKKLLFGKGEILARDVLMSDLNEEDMAALEAGFVQLLPSRDISGRLVVVISPMLCPENASISACQRVKWYFLSSNLKDEDTQRLGFVVVMMNTGETACPEDLRTCQVFGLVRSGLPRKMVALHYCFDNEALKPFVAGIQMALDVETRKHFRPHFGNAKSLAFELFTFGIPMNSHPMDDTGKIKLEAHKEWIQAVQNREKQEDPPITVVIPRRFDVLFGRGRTSREHTGNMRANHLVEMHEREYERAGKLEKTDLTRKIVQIITESHGRFLRWDEGGWVEVEMEEALKKISHFFRHLRSKRLLSSRAVAPTPELPEEKRGTKRVTPSSSPIHGDA